MNFFYQRPRLRSSFSVVMHTLLLLGLGILITLAPATAEVAQADPGYAYYWSLTFDFENNFNGILHVDVGTNQNGGVKSPALYGENFPVTCQRVGNVVLSGGRAKFDGGYLQCELDVKSALIASFGKCQQEYLGCTMVINDVEPYRNFRMLAQVISTATGSAPLFYHEDAAYTISPATTTTQLASTLTPIGTMGSSPVVAALGAPQSYAAEYECNGGAGCVNYFTIAGAMQSTGLPAQTVAFSTPSAKIYIGYNPDTGVTVPAGTELMHLVVDPPNFGNH